MGQPGNAGKAIVFIILPKGVEAYRSAFFTVSQDWEGSEDLLIKWPYIVNGMHNETVSQQFSKP